MIKINEGDYAYASARIRAMETKLLDDSRLSRMIDAPHAEEAFKVLSEAEYGFTGNLVSVHSFETLLAEEIKRCYLLLAEIAPQAEVIEAFQRKQDYFNIKVLLKAEFSGIEPPEIFMDSGTIEKEALQRIIREREYGDLTSIMQQAIIETQDVFSRTQDPQVVDLLMDKASYQQLVSDLKKIESPFLHQLVRILVDTTNIKMFIRARIINKAWDFLEKLLLQGGTIPEKTYFENSDKPLDAFVEELRFGTYGDALHLGWEFYKQKKNISGIEKLLDNLLMEYIRKARVVTMGVEPLVAYLYAKEAEIRNVRIIMTGKINKLPADVIRERLRIGYV